MKIIKTIDGHNVFVDDEDFDYISNCYDLHLNNGGYVMCRIKKKFKGYKIGLLSMSLHKILKNPEKKGRNVVVDHIDGNPLNNTKDNLRVTNHKNNMRNRKQSSKRNGKPISSIYKGVDWMSKLNAWRVQLGTPDGNKTKLYIGLFEDEVAGANAYNYYAMKTYGEYANLNNCPFMKKEEWMKYKRGNKTSVYRGVSLVNGKWIAQIWDGKRNIRIGEFDDEIECAKAYNEKAKEIKGEKAILNKI